MRLPIFLRLLLLALPLFAAACEDSDLFAEKKTPLTGNRQQLFPGGVVPNVDYNAPPIQPSNSNISVNTEVPKQLLADEPAAPPAPSPQQPQAKGAQKGRPVARGAAPAEDPNDPWAGARTTN